MTKIVELEIVSFLYLRRILRIFDGIPEVESQRVI